MKKNNIFTKTIRLNNMGCKNKDNEYINLNIKFAKFRKNADEKVLLGFNVNYEHIYNELMYILNKMYGNFAKELSCKITKFVNCSVHIQFKEIKTEPLNQNLNNITSNMNLNVIYIKELHKRLYTMFSPKILSLIIDNLFGNQSYLNHITLKTSEISPVSMYMNEQLIKIIVDTYSRMWKNKYTLVHKKFINNIDLMFFKNIPSIYDFFIITFFKINTDHWEEDLIINVPFNIVDFLRRKIIREFASKFKMSHFKKNVLKDNEQIYCNNVDNLKLNLVVTLKEFKVSIFKLLKLAKGDIFFVEKPDNVLVNVEESLILKGKHTISGTKHAVFIHDTIVK